jgi:hypothetical protein
MEKNEKSAEDVTTPYFKRLSNTKMIQNTNNRIKN